MDGGVNISDRLMLIDDLLTLWLSGEIEESETWERINMVINSDNIDIDIDNYFR